LSRTYASVLTGENSPGMRQGKRGASGIVPDPSAFEHTPEKQQGLSREQRHISPESSTTHGESGIENDLAENSLLALVRTGIENDFETVVFPQYPLLREIKRLLMGTSADGLFDAHPADSSGNAIYAALSGSGSALFGLYRSEADAREAQQRVQSTGCKAILTETLPRQEYWRTMFAE